MLDNVIPVRALNYFKAVFLNHLKDRILDRFLFVTIDQLLDDAYSVRVQNKSEKII